MTKKAKKGKELLLKKNLETDKVPVVPVNDLKINIPKELEKKEETVYINELKKTFALPKFGLQNRKMNVMARIDETTSKILDALVALDLAPSRSSAAAFLITEAIKNGREKYMKILESYETIQKAKSTAQYSFYKSLGKSDSEKID